MLFFIDQRTYSLFVTHLLCTSGDSRASRHLQPYPLQRAVTRGHQDMHQLQDLRVGAHTAQISRHR